MKQPTTKNNFVVLHKSETTPGPIFVILHKGKINKRGTPGGVPFWSACQGCDTVTPCRQLCQNLGNLVAVLCKVLIPPDKQPQVCGIIHVVPGLPAHDVHIGSSFGVDDLCPVAHNGIPLQLVHVPPVVHEQLSKDCQLVRC